MKKPKLNLDSAKLQSLFVRHVEKLLLVVVLMLVVWFIYRGYTMPGLEGNKTPEGLLQEATNTRSHIDNPSRWTEVSAERIPANANYSVEAGRSQEDTNPAGYHLPNHINRPSFAKLTPRVDPKIFPPINLVVVPVIGPLAGFPEGAENDPLTQSLIEEEPKDVKKKPKPKKKPAAPYGSEMYGSESSGYPAPRTAKGRKSRMSPMGESDLLGEGSSSESAEGYSGYGSGYGGSGGPLTMHPESLLGFAGQEASTIQRNVRAMEVMAVVPFEKQIQEFENALASSLDYDPQRDHPYYLQFWVERADSPDPEADPASFAWKQLGVKAAFDQAMTKWAGAPNEIIDTTYWDQKLTHPAPPFMQRDLWDLLVHPDVPLAVLNASGMPLNGVMPGAKTPTADQPTDDLPQLPTAGTTTGGYSGMESSGSGSGGFPFGAQGSGGYQPRQPGGGGSMGGMEGGSSYGYGYGAQQQGMGSSGYEGAGTGAVLAPPKYKLIRFTDTSVNPGTYYSYRIRVLLHDPNHPYPGVTPPSLPSLHDDVRKRIKEVDAADAKKGPNAKTYWLVSDPSEASKPTRLPDPRRYFVGGVTQPPSSVIVEKKPRVPQSQPQSKALTVVWDEATVVDVPAEKDVYRGTLLNFQAENVQVIHPVMRTIIEVPKFSFVTDAIVADMDGGDVLPPVDEKNDKPLKSPGELLVFDAEGNLHVQHETDDIEAYRRYTIPKPEVKPMQDPNNPYGAPSEGSESSDILGGSNSPGYGRPTRPSRRSGP